MCDELGDETYMQGLVEEKTGLTHPIRPTPAPPKPQRQQSPPKGPLNGPSKGKGGGFPKKWPLNKKKVDKEL